jgi:hypothetical protein
MESSIISHAANAMVLVWVIRTFEVNIVFYQGRDHLRSVLEMHIVVGRSVYDQILSLDLVSMVDG